MKIRLYGQRNHLGVGIFFSELSDALKSIYYIGNKIEEIDPFNLDQLNTALSKANISDVNVWFWQHPAIQVAKGINICWAIFELEKLPESYLAYLNDYADLIWVPSLWAYEVLVTNGIDRKLIDVVPGGVNSNFFHPYLRKPPPIERAMPFKFLAIGKHEERKGFRQLLEAFKDTFQNSSEVLLLIKGDFHLKHQEKKDQLNDLIKSYGLKNVKTYWGDWTQDLMIGLYNYADAFIYPSRAEGWGLPLIEAVACGLPVATTFYSGQTEFLGPIRGKFLEIDYQLEKIVDAEFLSYWPPSKLGYGRWANPSVSSISKNLIAIQDNYANHVTLALQASEVIRACVTWECAANITLKSMQSRNILDMKYDVQG